jgi:cytochrome P450
MKPAFLIALLLPLAKGLAWMTRRPNGETTVLSPEELRSVPLPPVTLAAVAADRTAPLAAPAAASPPPPRDDPPPPPPEDPTKEVTLQEYAVHYAQNIFQMMVPIPLEDNIPIVTVPEIFQHGAVDMPLGRIHLRDVGDVFTGGFQDITGVPVFVLLHRYMKIAPIYKLCIGPRSVVVISDAIAVKHVLRSELGKYDKGILAEVLKPIMGKGLIPADPITWLARRRAITPAFHQKWLHDQMSLYSTVGSRLVHYLSAHVGREVDLQAKFCSASLDIVGKAVFNYEFGSITRESPVIQAVYAVMREAERRASSIVPYWKLPDGTKEFDKHMTVLDGVLTSLVEQCIQQFSEPDQEEDVPSSRGNNSLLRFLVEARGEDVSTKQLRDDLMTMLIAGHETTAATLTWALHELSRPEHAGLLQEVRTQVREVLGVRDILTLDDVKQLPLVRYCLIEALRLYPAPPLLIRRCLKEDRFTAAGQFRDGITIRAGQDVMLATWSMHRDKGLWGDDADEYNPMRFLRSAIGSPEYQAAGWAGFDPARVRGLYPDESSADYGFVPFGGGGRRCVGDQFAMLESTVLLAMALRDFRFEAVAPVTLGMGATIFAKEGLMMKVARYADTPKAPRDGAHAAAEGAAAPNHPDSNTSPPLQM